MPDLFTPPAVEYPDSDGEPMSDNSLQYQWIVTLESGLADLFADRPDVAVHANNLIYPVEGDPKTRLAPDAYVAIGRPKGHRGSYRVWEEGGVFPQVVIEVLSPGNRAGEMTDKRKDYDRFGAEEYYVYDPFRVKLEVYRRGPAGLAAVAVGTTYTSPLLGVTFDMTGPELAVYFPNGDRFLTAREKTEQKEVAERRADAERRQRESAERKAAAAARREARAEARAAAEKERADAAEAAVAAEKARADALAAKLRALGLDPDAESPNAAG